MLKTKLLAVAVMLSLAVGCSFLPKQADPVPDVVNRIVTALPDSDDLPRVRGNEDLPIYNLTEDERRDFAKIAKAYAMSVEILKKRNANASEAIEGLRKAIQKAEKERDDYLRSLKDRAR